VRRRLVIFIGASIIAIAIAAALDRAVADWAFNSGAENFLDTHKVVRTVLKAPGEFWFTIVVAIVVGVVHKLKWRAGAFVLLGTAVSGINGLIKWIVGRTRPFHLLDNQGNPRLAPFELAPFRGGMGGLFVSKNLCFPSGHAALAFATAEALAMLYPRARWAFYVVATLVAAERVMENAHYLSDVVGAAVLGIAGVHLIRWIVTKGFRVQGSGFSETEPKLNPEPRTLNPNG
jgi:membrane-associated phospholipid phosphatase